MTITGTSQITPGSGSPRAPRRGKTPVVIAIAIALAGFVCIGVASDQSTLWNVIVLGMVGIVLIAVSMLWFNDRLVTEIGDNPTRRLALLFGFIFLAGLAFLGFAAWRDSAVLGMIGTFATVGGMLGLHCLWARQADEDHGELVRLWIAIELSIGGMLSVWALDSMTWIAWLGLLVWFVGLVAVKQTMAASLGRGRVSLRRTIRVSVDVAIAGTLSLIGGAAEGNQFFVLLGVAGVMAGLSVFGIAMMYVRIPSGRAWLVTLAGAVIVALGFWRARVVFGFPGLAAVLFTIVVVVGAWFVWRGEGIILVVFIGFVVVWGTTDPATSAALDPSPTADVQMLAMGDSFISGEGADQFFEGTNRVGRDRNECRRASTAHPYLVAEAEGYSLSFVACSGAKTADLFTCGQMSSAKDRCKPVEEWGDPPGDLDIGLAGQRPQLENFTDAELEAFDVVVLSIGGNDVGFSTIVKACLLPRSCNELSPTWLANVAALRETLVDTYSEIRARVPRAPIIVVPYPLVVDEVQTCDIGLDDAEVSFVRQFTEALDATIVSAAETAGVHVYTDGKDAFAGSRLCTDGGAAVHHLDLDPPNGSAVARYRPDTWIHNSMHPTPRGHQLWAFAGTESPDDGLQAFVRDKLAHAKDYPAEANPEPKSDATEVAAAAPSSSSDDAASGPSASESASAVPETTVPPDATVPDATVPTEPVAEIPIEVPGAAPADQLTPDLAASAAAAEVLLSDGDWMRNELYRTVYALLFPALVMLVGAIVLAVGFVNTEWWLPRLLRPSGTWRDLPPAEVPAPAVAPDSGVG